MKLKTFLIIFGLLLSFSAAAAEDKVYKKIGFLNQNDFVDAVAILPPPPAIGTTAFDLDVSMYYKGIEERSLERGLMAKIDADVSLDAVLKRFSDSFGMELSQENTPQIYALLQTSIKDARYSASVPKKHYKRIRPYTLFNESTCLPKDEKSLANNGSYPSGHTMIGTTIALILAEINPKKQNEILKRGYEYGQSRIICGYHWQSDVDAARLLAGILVNRLNANPEFMESIQKAKEEFERKQPSSL